MRVLFVVADLFFSEPLGAMILSGVCRQAGHQTRLAILRGDDIVAVLDEFKPDLVAYSAMTPDEHMFIEADVAVQTWIKRTKQKACRVMGGPHPTFFPQILQKMQLDAICSGDGERAILQILERLAEDAPLTGIPNVSTLDQPEFQKEIVEDMNAVPFADRELLYRAAPEMLDHGIRSFLTQKGCPYKCTYCFNHAYNRLFKGEGRKIIRRRSVDNLLDEIKDVVTRYPTVRFIRFSDDVFVIQKDAWIEEFAERFPKEIGLPFYCLLRCNSLTEDVARLLSKAGCRSVSMSIEAGSERVRNEIMKRNMPDKMMREAFALCRKYRINVFANTILAVPGTRFEDDMNSFRFARSLKAACPTFSVFSPFPGTDLTKQAIELGQLAPDFDFSSVSIWDKSVLSGYSDEERLQQANIAYLGQMFCKVPDIFMPIFPFLLRLPITRAYKIIFAILMSFLLGTNIFPGARPRGVRPLCRAVWASLKFMATDNKKRHSQKSEMRTPSTGFSSPDY